MPVTALTGSDTLIINGRVIADLADMDPVVAAFADDIADMKTAKNGNSIYALNEKGRAVELTIRVVLGSSDDQFLLALEQTMINDFSGFTLMTGSFVKRVGDGLGGVQNLVYQFGGGIFKKIPEAKTSAEGDVEQSVSIYVLRALVSSRSLQ